MKRLSLAILLALTIGCGLWAVENTEFHYQPTKPFNTWSGVATLTLKVLDKHEVMETVEVGVFTKGQNPVLRGVARCDTKNGVWWVSVHGDSTESMEFHLWDEATQTEKVVDQDWNFVVDGEDGTLADPYLLFWNKPRDLYENSVRINACSLKKDHLSIEDGVWPVSADMYNPNEFFCGVSFDLILPEGIKIKDEDGLWVWQGTRTETTKKVSGKNKQIFNDPSAELTDGVYHISIDAALDNETIKGVAGEILLINLVPDDPAFSSSTGTLSITNVVLTRLNGTTARGNDYTATLLMEGGGPVEDGRIAIEGQVSNDLLSELTTDNSVTSYDLTGAILDDGCEFEPANKNALLFIAPEDKDKTASDNVVADGECERLVLTDGHPFKTPVAFTAANATYTRDITNISTICLPFSPSTDEFEYFELEEEIGTALRFTKVDSPEAAVPYLYRKKSGDGAITASNVEISCDDAGEISKAGWKMTGTYGTKVFAAEDNIYALSAAKLYLNAGTLTMKPFRAYFTCESSGVKLMEICLEGEYTGIQLTENGQFITPNTSLLTPNYNLAGQIVDDSYIGIVIRNGVKIFQNNNRP